MDFPDISQYSPDNICICFDDDGVLHKWQDLKIDVPESYADMTAEEQGQFMHDAVYKILLSPNYYRNLPTMDGMVSLAQLLFRQGFDVKVLSCSINEDTSRQKQESLKACMPWIKPEDIILLPDGEGKRKFDYLPDEIKNNKLVILIDDHTPNCIAFEQAGGIAVKCINDINGRGKTWQGAKVYEEEAPEISVSVLLDRIKTDYRTWMETFDGLQKDDGTER